MTNGEKLKEIFPYLKSDKTDLVKVLNIDNLKSWWNAEYKESTIKKNIAVDWDELKRKILMEVDGGTDDAWLAYGEVCNRISNSIDEFVADMRKVEE